MQTDVVGRRHGDQALDPGEGHRAALGRAHQAAADAVLAVVLRRRGEDAVGPEALHGHGHAVCGVRTETETGGGGVSSQLVLWDVSISQCKNS